MKLAGMMLPVFLAAFLSVAACSVKEDRNPCPCLLELDIKGPDAESSGAVDILLTSHDGFMHHDVVDAWAEESRYSVSVPRTELHVRAWCGAGMNISESGLRIPLGQDCPKVYMHDSDVVTEGEYYREEVWLRKNHCVLTLVNKGEDNDFSDLVLKGNVSGYDAYGEPLAGDFEFSLGDASQQEYQAVLPRQRDDSLVLEMEDAKGILHLFHFLAASAAFSISFKLTSAIFCSFDYSKLKCFSKICSASRFQSPPCASQHSASSAKRGSSFLSANSATAVSGSRIPG